jgi:hypothetical protein
MQQVIVDISQNNVSFDSTSLVSMVQKELVLYCSKSFSVEEAENVNVCNFMKD